MSVLVAAYKLKTAPTEEPVSYAEAKAHLRLQHDNDQTYIEGLITAVRTHLEAICGRAFVTATWYLYLSDFPCENRIALERGNVQSITALTYVDENGSSQTFSASKYMQDTISEPGALVLKSTEGWPALSYDTDPYPVRLEWVAGFGTSAAVPAPLKQATKNLVAHLYENREPEVTGTIVAKYDFGVRDLIGPYRLVRF